MCLFNHFKICQLVVFRSYFRPLEKLFTIVGLTRSDCNSEHTNVIANTNAFYQSGLPFCPLACCIGCNIFFAVSFMKCAPIRNWAQLLSYKISFNDIELVGWLVRVSSDGMRSWNFLLLLLLFIHSYELTSVCVCVLAAWHAMNKLMPYKWKFRRNILLVCEKQQKHVQTLICTLHNALYKCT